MQNKLEVSISKNILKYDLKVKFWPWRQIWSVKGRNFFFPIRLAKKTKKHIEKLIFKLHLGAAKKGLNKWVIGDYINARTRSEMCFFLFFNSFFAISFLIIIFLFQIFLFLLNPPHLVYFYLYLFFYLFMPLVDHFLFLVYIVCKWSFFNFYGMS